MLEYDLAVKVITLLKIVLGLQVLTICILGVMLADKEDWHAED